MIICLAGMHRSGTSLMSSYLEHCGVPMGDRLLGAGHGNEHGHFEDCDFLEFHKNILEHNKSNFFIPRKNLRLSDQHKILGKMLLDKRSESGDNWGWKEPRTTLFLDYWSRLDPDIKFIFMYRDAYKVSESLYRRMKIKYKYFMPWLAPMSWLHYNREVLKFVERNPSRSLLVSIDGVNNAQGEVLQQMGSWLGVELDKPYSDVFQPKSMLSGTGKKMSLMVAVYMKMIRIFLGNDIENIYKRLQENAFINDRGQINARSQNGATS